MEELSHPQKAHTSDNQDRRCSQILDGASQCFVKHGFHGASMARVAKASGMSVGHIYHYFDSKDAIIAAIVEREREHMREHLDALVDTPPEQFLTHLVERVSNSLFRGVDPFQSLLNLEILAECQRNPSIAAIVEDHDNELREKMASLLRDKLGITDTDGRLEILLSLFHGLPSRVVRNPGADMDVAIPVLDKTIRSLLTDQH